MSILESIFNSNVLFSSVRILSQAVEDTKTEVISTSELEQLELKTKNEEK